jgi:carbohydrate-binding DOMON domain-containing protein
MEDSLPKRREVMEDELALKLPSLTPSSSQGPIAPRYPATAPIRQHQLQLYPTVTQTSRTTISPFTNLTTTTVMSTKKTFDASNLISYGDAAAGQ